MVWFFGLLADRHGISRTAGLENRNNDDPCWFWRAYDAADTRRIGSTLSFSLAGPGPELSRCSISSIYATFERAQWS